MLRKIKVYGSLAKFLKRRVFQADVANPAEAVRFLLANYPALRSHMSDQHYKVVVSNNALDIGDQPEQLHYPIGAQEEIKVVPVMAGAGGGVGKILLGAALIGISLALPGGGLFGGTAFGIFGGPVASAATWTTVATGLSVVGAGLVLGGTAQLLTPTPQLDVGIDSAQDPRKSFSFSGIQNVSRQGIPVPIVYGETIVGSVVISAAILTQDVI
jgi:predicted phage tail protein